MDAGIVLLSLITLGLIIGAALGWVAAFRISGLGMKITKIERELASLKQRLADKPAQHVTPEPARDSTAHTSASHAWPTQEQPGRVVSHEPITPAPVKARPQWQITLVNNWMIWLGGASVALAGIFMVRYSIEIGLLGPKARVTLAVFTGLGLHAAAEWLRRRNRGSDPVFAALAGGASITLYAALLAALHLYNLLDPRLVFILLAFVSLLTMALSLLHGPLLAAIGLIGAYVVPILVNTNSGNMVAALLYTLIISSAALVLQRYVFRYWLWWGVVAGALGWWLLSLGANQADTFRGSYLALLAWGMVALPGFDWFLRGPAAGSANHSEPGTRPVTLHKFRVQLIQVSLVLVILAWGFTMFRQGFSPDALVLWAPLVVIIFFATRNRDNLAALPWLTLIVQGFAWLLSAIQYDNSIDQLVLSGLAEANQPLFLTFAGFMSLIYSGLALLHVRARGVSHGWISLVLLAPLAWLALAYMLVNGISQSIHWSVLTLIAGVAYGTLAGILLQKGTRRETALWLTLGAHVAYSLAVAMYFREAGLTLALSAQLLSLSWLMKRHQLPWLGYIIKALVALIVIRLTFNPWLLSYPSDIHWSLWTYGGATLFSALAAMQCQSSPQIKRWLEAATLHLLVLTLGAELRYWLYDGEIFTHRYTLTEAAINTSLWAALGLAYFRRSAVSETLAELYRLCSRILLVMAIASYGIATLVHNPLWSDATIGTTPVFNILLLAYGLPVILALLVAAFHERPFRRPALGIAGLGALLFVTLEIRHLWQGGYLSLSRITSDGELYTYSIVWLLMAVAAVLAGSSWQLRDLYKTGIALLAVVIAKIFLVDMSDLEGLLRVASFMGLGLSLLGLAWLHGRIKQNQSANDGNSPPLHEA